MAQQNEQNHNLDSEIAPVKRKRGRPRKEEVQGPDSSGRSQRRRRNSSENPNQSLIGQPVSGMLDGVFDTGFLISVRVGNGGPLLRGMVFDSRFAVPVSDANDIAPHIKMSKREEIVNSPVPPSVVPLQRREAYVHTSAVNRVGVDADGQGSILKMDGSEAVNFSTPGTVHQEKGSILKKDSSESVNFSTPGTVQVSNNQERGSRVEIADGQGKDLTGEQKADMTSQKHQGEETAGEPTGQPPATNEMKIDPVLESSDLKPSAYEIPINKKPDPTVKQTPVKETSDGQEIVSEPVTGHAPEPVSETMSSPVNVTVLSEPKRDSGNQQSPVTEADNKSGSIAVNETVGNETLTEIKPPANESDSKLKSDSSIQKSSGNDAVSELQLDSSCQKSPDPKSETEQKLASESEDPEEANPEVLEGIKEGPDW